MRPSIHAVLLIFFILCALNGKSFGDTNSGLESSLQQEYLHKVFTIRNFYADDALYFAGDGSAKASDHTGSWTVAGIAIEKIKITANHVELSGKRVAEIYDGKAGKFVPVLTKQDLRIFIDRDGSQSDENLLTALKRIFLGSQDRLGELVPDSWKVLVSGAVEVVPQNHGADCFRVKGEESRTADGNIVFDCDTDARVKQANPEPSKIDPSTLPYRAGKGVIAPRPEFTPDPAYNPVARAAGVQGVSILHAVVATDGTAKDIVIVRPLGFGLDDEAVASMRRWKFQPATLQGQPVSTRITVQFQFQFSTGSNNLLYKYYSR